MRLAMDPHNQPRRKRQYAQRTTQSGIVICWRCGSDRLSNLLGMVAMPPQSHVCSVARAVVNDEY
jgi:hypothetical protein